MHEYREHRKIAFHAKLLEQSWDVIFDSEDVESASRYLQSMLRDLMNENFPANTVRMSTCDPPWMTPLAKALLKKKAKAKCRSPDGCPITLKEKISAIVAENRKSLASERWALRPGGKRSMRCQREKKDPTQALTRTLCENVIITLQICHDEDYIRSVPMDIMENIPVPQLTLSQV